jgi:hypothetical protein
VQFSHPKSAIQPQELEEFISGRQTAKNIQGRGRVINGALVGLSSGDVPSVVSPADDLDFIVVDGVLSEAECATLCDAFRSISSSVRNPASDNAFWAGRIVYAHELTFKFLPLALRMKDLCHYSAELLGKFYNLNEAIFADTERLVFWPEGTHMNAHADNANADGTPHRMAWRRFSSVIDLNDDCEGGELYFSALNKIVEPKRGRLVAFTAGFHHEHAILKIRKGNRYILTAFFSNNEDRADEFLYS